MYAAHAHGRVVHDCLGTGWTVYVERGTFYRGSRLSLGATCPAGTAGASEPRRLPHRSLPGMAWLWARTVKSPKPAYSHVDVPLVSTFVVSSKPGKESYIHPIVEGDQYHFTVRTSKPPIEAEQGTKAKGRGSSFRCILADSPINGDYIKSEGQNRTLEFCRELSLFSGPFCCYCFSFASVTQ